MGDFEAVGRSSMLPGGGLRLNGSAFRARLFGVLQFCCHIVAFGTTLF